MTTLGTLLVVVGTIWLGAASLVNAANRWPADGGLRRLGRVVLRAFGVVTRASCWPFRAYYRYLTERVEDRCARLGHVPSWDGCHESCSRCGTTQRWEHDGRGWRRRWPRVDVDRETARAWVAELDHRTTTTRDALAADAARLRDDARRNR